MTFAFICSFHRFQESCQGHFDSDTASWSTVHSFTVPTGEQSKAARRLSSCLRIFHFLSGKTRRRVETKLTGVNPPSLRVSRNPLSPKVVMSQTSLIYYHRERRDQDPQTLHERPLIHPLPPKVFWSFRISEEAGESAGARVRFQMGSE